MSERNPFDLREVKSRRGGKVKEPLSRDRIVEEALRLLTSEGAEGMSLRKVALALETGPASLYAYVHDLESLRALVFDRALAAVETKPANRKNWKSALKFVLTSYTKVLMATPGLAALALTHIAVGPNALRIIEAMLDALAKGDLDTRSAAWAVDLLLLYATAISAQHGGTSDGTSRVPDPVANAVRAVSESSFPRIHAARAELTSGEGGQRFTWALDTLLAGVLQNAKRAASDRRERARGPRGSRP
jgi:AcrR family transcriptional regulator